MNTLGDEALEDADDAHLLRLSRDGSRRAFSELWRRHAPIAIAYARSLGPAPLDPDDVVSEAFLSILRLVSAGKGPEERLRPYLLTTVRNVRLNAIRRVPPAAPLDEVEPQPSALGAVDVDAMVDSEAITEAFRSLPERWQHALWLSEVEQLPPRTIAEILGLRPNSVSALTYRARDALRKAWINAQLRRAPHGTRHAQVIELLGAYVQDDLSLRSHRMVTSHLDECPSCRAAANEAKRLARTLTLAPFLLGGVSAAAVPALFSGDVAAAAVSATTTTAATSTAASGVGVHAGWGVAAGHVAPALWPVAAAAVIAVTVGGAALVRPAPPAEAAVVAVPAAIYSPSPPPSTLPPIEPLIVPLASPSPPVQQPVQDPAPEITPAPAPITTTTPPPQDPVTAAPLEVPPVETRKVPAPVQSEVHQWELHAWIIDRPGASSTEVAVSVSGSPGDRAVLSLDGGFETWIRLDTDGEWSGQFDIADAPDAVKVAIRYIDPDEDHWSTRIEITAERQDS